MIVKHTATKVYASNLEQIIKMNSQGVMLTPMVAKLLGVEVGDYVTSGEDADENKCYIAKAEAGSGNKLGERFTCGGLKALQHFAKAMAGYPNLETKGGHELQFDVSSTPVEVEGEDGTVTKFFELTFKAYKEPTDSIISRIEKNKEAREEKGSITGAPVKTRTVTEDII